MRDDYSEAALDAAAEPGASTGSEGDVTVPRSVFGGGVFIVAGVCWAVAAVMDYQKRRRRVTRRA